MKIFKKFISKSARLFGYVIVPVSYIVDQEVLFDECAIFFKQDEELIILDVGAHHGKFTETAAKKFPKANIYAFEPQLSDFLILKGRMSSFKNVKVINIALSDNTGEQTMYITKESASSSFLKSKGKYYPNQHNIGKEVVRTITLAEWTKEEGIDFIHLLKLDIQGYELNLLEHSGDILKRTQFIFSDIHFQPQYIDSTNFFELSNFLFSRGFELYNIYNIRRMNKRAMYSDGLYIRKDLLTSLKNANV